METNDTTLLQKAYSAAAHLARINKATSNFHEKMGKLHKAHEGDMRAAVTQMHKILGIESIDHSIYGDMEPKPTNLLGAGTENLQEFGSFSMAAEVAALIKSEVDKAVAAATKAFPPKDDKKKDDKDKDDKVAKGDDEKVDKADDPKVSKGACPTCKKDMSDCKCKAEKAAGDEMTKEEITTLVEGVMEKSLDKFAENFAKAMFGKPDENEQGQDASVHFNPQQVQKAAGVGDRTQLQQPVARIPSTVEKGTDSGIGDRPLTHQGPTPELAQRALNGDQSAILDFMKSARPSEIPNVLVEPLSKIH